MIRTVDDGTWLEEVGEQGCVFCPLSGSFLAFNFPWDEQSPLSHGAMMPVSQSSHRSGDSWRRTETLGTENQNESLTFELFTLSICHGFDTQVRKFKTIISR